MKTREEKQPKAKRGFTPRIDDDLYPMVLKIQAKRMVKEEKTVSMNQVVSDLIRSAIKKDHRDIKS